MQISRTVFAHDMQVYKEVTISMNRKLNNSLCRRQVIILKMKRVTKITEVKMMMILQVLTNYLINLHQLARQEQNQQNKHVLQLYNNNRTNLLLYAISDNKLLAFSLLILLLRLLLQILLTSTTTITQVL